MKSYKPLLLAILLASLDFIQRYLRHFQVDLYFLIISFIVFYSVLIAVSNKLEVK